MSTGPFRLGAKSLATLAPVHPDLYAVVRLAIRLSTQDFTVFEGLRTPERQHELYAAGKSKTLDSRHLTGHAVDLVPLGDGGRLLWEPARCAAVAKAVKAAASQLGVPIEWGGDWKTFYDGPHFQLPRKEYVP
jgi:peptidoglycan LD-endopeptidase CwlK